MKEKIKNLHWRKIIGLFLIIAGIVIILAVIFVPIINKNRNKKQVDAVKKNINVTAEPSKSPEISSEVTGDVVDVSQEAATLSPEEEARQKREALLQESNCIGIIIIEKIGVELAIEEGDDDETLKRAVGHMPSSAAIGEKGNCVISAHHGGFYGEFFLNVDKLEKEDIIQLVSKDGTVHNYAVYERKVVKRTDWSVVDELNEQETLTIITCVDSSQEERIIVSAIAF